MNHSIDIYRIINGQYFTNELFEQIEIKDVNFPTEILEFCNLYNVIISNRKEDILICRYTKQPKYFIK